MSIKITCPKNDTNIQLDVSGKSVKEVAFELGALGWILNAITETDDSFKDGFAFKDETGEYPKPLPHLKYREWDDYDDEFAFSSNSIIRGYAIKDDVVNVQVDPTFMEWARTDKPMDEYCKAQQAELKAHTTDTSQTAEKVSEFQALCGVEIDPDDINRRVANAYAVCGMNESQTDCGWK